MATTAFMPTSQHNQSNYFLNPVSGGPSPPEQYFYGPQHQQAVNYPPSPIAQTPPNLYTISPTNHTSMHVRQLRQPRQPLYVPAALRPTELPIPTGRPRAPDTPPASKDNSFDGNNTATYNGMAASLGFALEGSQGEEELTLRRGITRVSGEGLAEPLEEVTGPPTTAHWKPDAAGKDCSVCHIAFTWFFRRHHCRRCGDLICDNHSRATVPLDQNARIHPYGTWSKACDPCSAEWKIVKNLRKRSRAGSMDELAMRREQQEGEASVSPSVAVPNQAQRVLAEQQRVGSMAHSEGGMIWSTF